jgi:hypothetical protein
MEKKRLVYERPQARDLSAPTVSGQDVLGDCITGWAPGANPTYCEHGGAAGLNCLTGYDYDSTPGCSGGSTHTIPACDVGSGAI